MQGGRALAHPPGGVASGDAVHARISEELADRRAHSLGSPRDHCPGPVSFGGSTITCSVVTPGLLVVQTAFDHN